MDQVHLRNLKARLKAARERVRLYEEQWHEFENVKGREMLGHMMHINSILSAFEVEDLEKEIKEMEEHE